MDYSGPAFHNGSQPIVFCANMGTSRGECGHFSAVERSATNQTCLVEQRTERHKCEAKENWFSCETGGPNADRTPSARC